MADQQQFTVGRVINTMQKSKEIGNDTMHVLGVSSADITCACGHAWTAREHRDLDNIVGGVVITCPACHVKAVVHTRLMRAGQ